MPPSRSLRRRCIAAVWLISLGEQRRRVTSNADAPPEDRPDRPEIPTAARRPDRDEHHVDDDVDREMGSNTRFERAAAMTTPGLRTRGREVGGQSVELRHRAD